MGGNSWDKVRGLQDSLHGMGSSLGSGLTALDPSGYLGGRVDLWCGPSRRPACDTPATHPVGNKPREPETAFERLKACSCCPGLSYRQRLLGSILCFAFGTLISLSAAPIAVRRAVSAYTRLLIAESDSSVKLIILGRLKNLRKHHSSVLGDMAMDILRS